MGAWGEKILENDSAQDFIEELSRELKEEKAYKDRNLFLKDLTQHVADEGAMVAVEFCLSRKSLRKIIPQPLKDLAITEAIEEMKEIGRWRYPERRKAALEDFIFVRRENPPRL